jgi:hypothetical protein
MHVKEVARKAGFDLSINTGTRIEFIRQERGVI